MASSAEREIRDAIVQWAHTNEPLARVVHELNVAGTGSNRADLALVFPDILVLVEIKSERDTLKRLRDQFDAFTACSHALVIAAHECHFEGDSLKGCDWMTYSHRDHLWRYPVPSIGWDLDRYRVRREPGAHPFLELLWTSELTEEMERHRLFTGTGSSARWHMIHTMTLGLTGRQIREAVCRQLRKRAFAEADAPIVAQLAA
jgi:hypothetical protein